jgi:hypothetical protein
MYTKWGTRFKEWANQIIMPKIKRRVRSGRRRKVSKH